MKQFYPGCCRWRCTGWRRWSWSSGSEFHLHPGPPGGRCPRWLGPVSHRQQPCWPGPRPRSAPRWLWLVGRWRRGARWHGSRWLVPGCRWDTEESREAELNSTASFWIVKQDEGASSATTTCFITVLQQLLEEDAAGFRPLHPLFQAESFFNV